MLVETFPASTAPNVNPEISDGDRAAVLSQIAGWTIMDRSSADGLLSVCDPMMIGQKLSEAIELKVQPDRFSAMHNPVYVFEGSEDAGGQRRTVTITDSSRRYTIFVGAGNVDGTGILESGTLHLAKINGGLMRGGGSLNEDAVWAAIDDIVPDVLFRQYGFTAEEVAEARRGTAAVAESEPTNEYKDALIEISGQFADVNANFGLVTSEDDRRVTTGRRIELCYKREHDFDPRRHSITQFGAFRNGHFTPLYTQIRVEGYGGIFHLSDEGITHQPDPGQRKFSLGKTNELFWEFAEMLLRPDLQVRDLVPAQKEID